MPQFHVRVSEKLHDKALAKSEEFGISLSDLIREAVSQLCTNGATQTPTSPDELQHYREQIATLQQHLAEQSQRHDTIVLQLTQQLDRVHLQLEDHQKRRWWHRIFAR